MYKYFIYWCPSMSFYKSQIIDFIMYIFNHIYVPTSFIDMYDQTTTIGLPWYFTVLTYKKGKKEEENKSTNYCWIVQYGSKTEFLI